MVAQLSHNDHVILEGHSGSGLGCNDARPKGFSWVQLGQIWGTNQVGGVLRGVGEVTLMGLM